MEKKIVVLAAVLALGLSSVALAEPLMRMTPMAVRVPMTSAATLSATTAATRDNTHAAFRDQQKAGTRVNDVVSRELFRVRAGTPSAMYHGYYYYFTADANRNLFVQDPKRYVE